MKTLARRALALGVPAMLALAAPLVGQEAPTGFTFAPRAGVFLPTRSLGAVPYATQLADAAPLMSRASLGAGLQVGAALSLDLQSSPVVWRLDLGYVPFMDVRVDGEDSPFDASAAMLIAGIATRPPPDRLLRPYLMAGAGMRVLRFQPAASAGPQFPADSYDLAARVGGGMQLDLGPIAIVAEAEDMVSSFEFDEVAGVGGGDRRFQNDIVATIGVKLRMR